MFYRSPWMTEELDSVRDLARKFLAKESEPNHERWTKQGCVDREFWNAAGSVGLLCVSCPEEYGVAAVPSPTRQWSWKNRPASPTTLGPTAFTAQSSPIISMHTAPRNRSAAGCRRWRAGKWSAPSP